MLTNIHWNKALLWWQENNCTGNVWKLTVFGGCLPLPYDETYLQYIFGCLAWAEQNFAKRTWPNQRLLWQNYPYSNIPINLCFNIIGMFCIDKLCWQIMKMVSRHHHVMSHTFVSVVNHFQVLKKTPFTTLKNTVENISHWQLHCLRIWSSINLFIRPCINNFLKDVTLVLNSSPLGIHSFWSSNI